MKEQVYIQNSKKQKKRTETIILCAVLAIIVIIGAGIGAFVLFEGGSKGDDFDYYLETANQYVETKNYQEAIKNYWFAIEKNQTNEGVYASLGAVYEVIDKPVDAIDVYTLGYTRTNSSRLAQLANSLNVVIYGSDELIIKDTPELMSAVSLNTPFLNKMRSATFSDLVNIYGEPSVDKVSSKYCVSFNNGSITVYYYNTALYGTSVDVATNTPKSGYRPNEISLSRLSYIFTDMAEIMTYEQLTKQNLTGLSKYFDKELNKDVVSFTYEDCKIVIECNEEGNIEMTAWNRIYPDLSVVKEEQREAEKFAIDGIIISAVTGEPVEQARITVYNAEDVHTPVSDFVTGANGDYSFEELEEGEYIINVSAEGYIEENFEIDVNSWENNSGREIPISPELKAGEIRIVLTWNDTPRDLDSYLEGVSSTGSNVYVSYRNKSVTDHEGKEIAVLDLDDTDGNGPETTTIYDVGGDYTFTVRDYNHTGTMATMGATVKVYVGDGAPMIFEVPNDVVDGWEVFRVVNGEIETINSAVY